MSPLALTVIAVAVLTLLMLMWIVGSLFRRVGPNRALIVYGFGGTHIHTKTHPSNPSVLNPGTQH